MWMPIPFPEWDERYPPNKTNKQNMHIAPMYSYENVVRYYGRSQGRIQEFLKGRVRA